MGIKSLFGFGQARDKPVDKAADAGYSFLFGRTTSGKPVNERTAMQTTAVYACVRILAEAVASLPLHVYEYQDDGGKKLVHDHPLYYLLHDEPNPEMTSFVFRETLMSHLLIWGNAYAQIIRDGAGRVLGLYPLLPDKMEVQRDDKGNIYYVYSRNSDENPTFKEYAVGMTLACEEYGASFFANGANPGGVLEHPGVLKDPSKVRESWNSVYRGVSNAHKIAVLEEGMKYQQIGIPPEEAQFLETRKFQINEIARLYRIPPHMVGDLDKSSFSNIEQQSLEFVKYTLDPWVIRWEQSLQRSLLLPGEKGKYFIKLNVDGLLRGDYQSRMNGYAVGRQNGWFSANDIREMENMNPIPDEEGGNLYLINGAMTKLADAGAFAKTDTGQQNAPAQENSGKRGKR
jgi:phage portal protein BeeE